MKRYILLGLGVIAAAFAAYVAYTILTTKSHSPADSVSFEHQDLFITVDYSRPFKKDRLIFGREEDDALQPWGVYWRTGANEATEVEFSKDVSLNGQTVEKGRYVLYTVPGENAWQVYLNSELGRWGYNEPNHKLDVLETTVTPRRTKDVTEQFTISFESVSDSTLNLLLTWDQTQVPIPIGH